MGELSLVEKLLLLSLDDVKGNSKAQVLGFEYGVTTAILMDMIQQEIFELQGDLLQIKDRAWSSRRDEASTLCFQIISKAKKNKKLKTWIDNISTFQAAKIRKMVIVSLLEKKILRKEPKSFLWIFRWNRYPTLNPKPERELRQHLSQVINKNLSPTKEDVILLSLVETFKLIPVVFGKENEKETRKKIIDLLQSDQFAKALGKHVKEMTEALQVMMTSVAVTTVIITN